MRIHSPVLVSLAAVLALGAFLSPTTAQAASLPPAAHIVFLVSSPEDANSYESARTLPPFTALQGSNHSFPPVV